MKILQMANYYHPTSGGLRRSLDALASGYTDSGHEVTLVVPGEHTGASHSIGCDGGRQRTVTIRSPRIPRSGGYRAIIDQRAVADVVARVRPDVIELSDKTSLAQLVGGLRSRPPVVLFSHERLDRAVDLRTPQILAVSGLTDRWTRRLFARVEAVVCASEFAAAELLRAGTRTVDIVPLGVDLEQFSPRSAPPGETQSEHLPWSAGSHYRAIMVSRLSVEKQPHDAVAATDLLVRSGRMTELAIVGDGPMRATLEQAAAGLPVRFVGHVADSHTLAAFLRAADVALAPSPHETFGLAALEAMACGVPVICAAGGAVGELLTPGTGLVAAPGPAGLAGAISTIFEGDREHQRVAARARAEEFGWDRTVLSMLEIFERTIAARSAGAA